MQKLHRELKIEDCEIYEEGEDDGPDDGEKNGKDGRDESIEPDFGLTEQNEGESPDRVKPMS